MSHVFLSYSSKHRELTRQLAAVLAGQGYTVWWDHALESWGSYEAQISAALNEASAVVVIWNEDAARSDWVKAEAEAAHRKKKLINVRPADMPFAIIPKPYNVHHIKEIDDHEGILRSLATVIAGKALPPEVPLSEFYFADAFSASSRRPRSERSAPRLFRLLARSGRKAVHIVHETVERAANLMQDSSVGLPFLGQMAMRLVADQMIFNSLTVKHEAYQHEREVRLIIPGEHRNLTPHVSTRPRGGDIVPFIKNAMRIQANGSIVEIVIGPAATDSAEYGVCTLLKSFHDAPDSIVRRSAIPYRAH